MGAGSELEDNLYIYAIHPLGCVIIHHFRRKRRLEREKCVNESISKMGLGVMEI